MPHRRDANVLPPWADSLLTPGQRLAVRRRFGLPENEAADTDGTMSPPAAASSGGRGGGQGGGTPAPTSPSAPAGLTRPVSGRR